GVRLRVGLQRGAETGQVLEALRVGDLRHFALDALDLGQADLVDLLRGFPGTGHLRDLEAETPQQIHEIGLAEVKRIEGEMTKIAHAQGFKDLASFRASLKTNPKTHATSRE